MAAKARTTQDAPTEIYLPDFHFPASQSVVTVSDGEWAIDYEEIKTVKVQRLRWWHREGEQEIKIQGVKRKAAGLMNEGSDEVSYLEQCQRGECVMM